MTLSFLRTTSLVLVLGSLAACGGGEPPAATGKAPAAKLETLVVSAGAGGGERLFDGVVEAVQQATLAAQTSGRIVALERDVDAAVKRGDVIMRIAAVEQRAGLDRAKAAAVEARATYQRVRDLRDKGLVSQSDMDRATAGRDAADAALAAATEQLSYTEVRAPFAGVVTQRYAEVGQAVGPGQPLVGIAALGALRVNVDVPQGLADEIRSLGTAHVYAGSRMLDAAKLTVFPAAAAASNTVRVRVDLQPGVKDLYPGMFVKAGFPLPQPAAAAVRVPASAIVRRSEVTGVYVVGKDGDVSLRQVRLGRLLGGDYEVLAGLAAGERIAADPIAATLAVEGR